MKGKMTEITIDDKTLLDLLDLQEQTLVIDRAIKRRVAHFIKEQGIDPDKHQLKYDILNRKVSYEPISKKTVKDA